MYARMLTFFDGMSENTIWKRVEYAHCVRRMEKMLEKKRKNQQDGKNIST